MPYLKDGRMQMKEVAGTERVINCDYVFLALGFLGPEGLPSHTGVQRIYRAPRPRHPWFVPSLSLSVPDREETEKKTGMQGP